MSIKLTFEEWFEELTEIFDSFEDMAYPNDTGWVWKSIWEEGLTPMQAYNDWVDSIS